MTCRLVRAGEISAAMRLVLSTGPAKASDEAVLDFLRYAVVRGIDTTQVWVAERGAQITSAILPVPSAGRTLLLLSPSLGAHADTAILLEHVLDEYAGRGYLLAQVLLDPGEVEAIGMYGRAGFERLAELIYLQAGVRRGARQPEWPAGCEVVTYSEERHGVFARTIQATYEGSLDCPALAGRRDIEDVVAGHRATGEFDPSLWYLVMEDGKGVGVVLLAPAPPTESMELVYLGLVPGGRGKDLGDLLVRQAFWATRERGLSMLTLAVDSQNVPALKLYFRHGMKRVQGKVAMMREIGGGEKGERREEKVEGRQGEVSRNT